MEDILKNIGKLGLLPVAKIENSNKILMLGKALLAGDIHIIEITFGTTASLEAMNILKKELPDIVVGAGTVLSIKQAEQAINAGARFISSPSFMTEVIDYCVVSNILVIPGINTAKQIEIALEKGLKVVKFFTNQAAEGLQLLKEISSPFTGIKYIPAGVINQDNLRDYLSFNKVHACEARWIGNTDLVSSGKSDEITKLAKEAVGIVLGFEFAHLGINNDTADKAFQDANFFSEFFYLPVKEGPNSIFAGTRFEFMKSKYLGKNGHIAIATKNIHRAIAHLEKKGILTLPETAKKKEGILRAIYLDREVSGFSIHLVQK